MYNIGMNKKPVKEVLAMLNVAQLKHFFGWCKTQKDKQGRDLLERARAYLLESPEASKYATEVAVLEETTSEGFNVLEWSCSCPQGTKTKAPICKHAVAVIILQNRKTLEQKSSKWAEFFKAYDEAYAKALEDMFKGFENF